jgi:Enoyl-(Acyl carrier protein) reductase
VIFHLALSFLFRLWKLYHEYGEYRRPQKICSDYRVSSRTVAKKKDTHIPLSSCSPGGIGNSLAREFQGNGLRVFATARDAQHIQDLDAIGIETLTLVVDSEESVKACFNEVTERLKGKGLDYLVNNA